MNYYILKLDNILKEILFKGNIFVSLKVLNLLSYYMIPFLLISVFTIFLLGSDKYLFNEFLVFIGELGFNLLLFIMFVKPLSAIFYQFKILGRLVSLRRQFGIVIFFLVFFHGLGLMIHLDYLRLDSIIGLFDFSNYIFYGLIGLLLMFFLFITSNNFSVRLLKRNWKSLQRLAYVALLFSVIHVMMLKGEIGGYMLLIVYFILKIMEWKKVSYTFNLQRFI